MALLILRAPPSWKSPALQIKDLSLWGGGLFVIFPKEWQEQSLIIIIILIIL